MAIGENPYAVGTTAMSSSFRNADLGKRFLGALADGLAGLVFVGPGYAIMIASGVVAGDDGDVGIGGLIGILLVLVGALALLGTQIYLLVTRSQTLGKYLVKTQIVDANTGQPADFLHSFVLRMLVNGIITAIPCIGSIYALVDICFIFREDRRCIHDHIATTRVVDIS